MMISADARPPGAHDRGGNSRGGGGEGGGLARARAVLLKVMSVEVGALVVTGIALFFVYRPPVSHAFGDGVAHDEDWQVRTSSVVRLVHHLVSELTVPTAIAAGVALGLRGQSRARRWSGALVGAGIAVTTLAASLTGFLLPWDALVFSSRPVGPSGGFLMLFRHSIRFVLIGGVEVTPSTVARWLLVHMLILGPPVGGLVVSGWQRQRSLLQRPRDVRAEVTS